MLGDLTKDDWLSLLDIPEERVPRVLILRGTRNFEAHYEHYAKFFENVARIGTPNGIIDHVFIGNLDGLPVGYASVYGAAMASEIVHLFGVLGTSLVIQTGCCGALADHLQPGDLFSATEAFCGEGAAEYYDAGEKVVRPLSDVDLPALSGGGIHRGPIYTTAALFAEHGQRVEEWYRDGWHAVDMETATTFAVANHFGMQSASLLFAFDNPRHKDQGYAIIKRSADLVAMRQHGNDRMIEIALETAQQFS